SVVTGKPLTIGGSVGREEATGRGVLFCMREALAKERRAADGLRVVVQGFGNVGSVFARLASEFGATVIGLSDSSGGVYNEHGIDVAAALAHKRAGGRLTELG